MVRGAGGRPRLVGLAGPIASTWAILAVVFEDRCHVSHYSIALPRNARRGAQGTKARLVHFKFLRGCISGRRPLHPWDTHGTLAPNTGQNPTTGDNNRTPPKTQPAPGIVHNSGLNDALFSTYFGGQDFETGMKDLLLLPKYAAEFE